MCRENGNCYVLKKHFLRTVSLVTAILGKVLEADAKIPRKQRFKGNHCWKLALFLMKKLFISKEVLARLALALIYWTLTFGKVGLDHLGIRIMISDFACPKRCW